MHPIHLPGSASLGLRPDLFSAPGYLHASFLDLDCLIVSVSLFLASTKWKAEFGRSYLDMGLAPWRTMRSDTSNTYWPSRLKADFGQFTVFEAAAFSAADAVCDLDPGLSEAIGHGGLAKTAWSATW